jgi:uncharacterized damage-inducible protein DinB
MDFQKELIAEYDREIARTRKMLEAIPAAVDFTFKPHPKSMALGRLAGHVVETAGEWASSTLNKVKLEFSPEHKFEAYIPASKEALIERFDKDVAKVKADLASFDPAKWSDNWKFVAGGKAWIDESKYEVWRSWVMNHLIHHRAQLGSSLRQLDKPIPGMYGPSADEGM